VKLVWAYIEIDRVCMNEEKDRYIEC